LLGFRQLGGKSHLNFNQLDYKCEQTFILTTGAQTLMFRFVLGSFHFFERIINFYFHKSEKKTSLVIKKNPKNYTLIKFQIIIKMKTINIQISLILT
jgi:hypothetical protein